MADDYLQVTTTTDSQSHARLLARGVVEARLAACVQVLGPLESTYWWKGEMEEAVEWMCLMKTTTAAYSALEAFLRRSHTYETPEITASPVSRGSAGYLDWISAEVGQPSG